MLTGCMTRDKNNIAPLIKQTVDQPAPIVSPLVSVQANDPLIMFVAIVSAVVFTCIICGVWARISSRPNLKHVAGKDERVVLND